MPATDELLLGSHSPALGLESSCAVRHAVLLELGAREALEDLDLQRTLEVDDRCADVGVDADGRAGVQADASVAASRRSVDQYAL